MILSKHSKTVGWCPYGVALKPSHLIRKMKGEWVISCHVWLYMLHGVCSRTKMPRSSKGYTLEKSKGKIRDSQRTNKIIMSGYSDSCGWHRKTFSVSQPSWSRKSAIWPGLTNILQKGRGLQPQNLSVLLTSQVLANSNTKIYNSTSAYYAIGYFRTSNVSSPNSHSSQWKLRFP